MNTINWLRRFCWLILASLLLSACSLAIPVSTSSPKTRMPSQTSGGLVENSASDSNLQANWKFVFASHGGLWIKEGESEPRLLTDIGDITGVKISPDGKQIVFTRQDNPSNIELWLINADGSDIHQLTNEKTLEGDSTTTLDSFSPDGKIIVFVFRLYQPPTYAFREQIWAAYLDGSGVKKLVGVENLKSDFKIDDESDFIIWRMSWISGTKRIIYSPGTLHETMFDPVMWVDVETGEMSEFLPQGSGGAVSFSPDGSKYAVATSSGVALAEVDSQKILTKITFPGLKYPDGWLISFTPTWAPVSSVFLITLPSDGFNQNSSFLQPVTIWRLMVDGTDPVQVLTFPSILEGIEFSPDAEIIAYVGGYSIQLFDQSGSMFNEITTLDISAGISGKALMYFSQWSPDSRHFSYSIRDDDCACGYYLIADVYGDETIELQSKQDINDAPGFIAPKFIAWLDPNYYIFTDYSSAQSSSPKLILRKLGGERLSWSIDTSEYDFVVDYWTP